jgi:predicted permease
MPVTTARSGVHGAGDDGGARAAVIRALKGALSNPMPWSIVAGALFSLAGVKASGPLYTVVSMLADAASPVALFTIGAVLWRAQQHAHSRTPMSRVVPVVALKLLLHPLLVLMAALAARRLGAPLSLEVITVLVLTAALPSASNVSILAERFGADNGRIARIIMLSTVLAFVSFTSMAWLFGVRPRG